MHIVHDTVSSLSYLHTSCRGYLIPGSTRLIVQYCKRVRSRSTTSDDLFVDTTLMATQSLREDNSDLSENEDVQEIEDPILVGLVLKHGMPERRNAGTPERRNAGTPE